MAAPQVRIDASSGVQDDRSFLIDSPPEPEHPPVRLWKQSTQDSLRGPNTLFVDPVAMKEKIREAAAKETYDVAQYYWKEGLFPDIARSSAFEKMTLLVIAFNAIWIAIDTDLNDADVLLEAQPVFQIAEHFFCIYFSFEWFVRFKSFARKANGLKDGWFVFDSSLVFMMVLETWVMTCVMLLSGSGGGGGLGNASILRMARLLRLSRMARMARLFRAMPELLILIKGMVAAMRSVVFTLWLLAIIIYVFGIAFRQLVGTTVLDEAGNPYFGSVPNAMHTLLLDGTLMDGTGAVVRALSEESFLYAALFYLFILLAALTVMNMLIGVLCEVVSTVAATEKESLTVNFVSGQLRHVMSKSGLDDDGDGLISREEFSKMLEFPDACRALKEVGVDVINLVDNIDFIFPDEDNDEEGSDSGGKKLTFRDFMNIVLMLRGDNTATVKDIVDLRKFIKTSHEKLREELKRSRPMAKSPSGGRQGLLDSKANSQESLQLNSSSHPPVPTNSWPLQQAVPHYSSSSNSLPQQSWRSQTANQQSENNRKEQRKKMEQELWHRRAMLVDALVTAQSELAKFVEALPAGDDSLELSAPDNLLFPAVGDGLTLFPHKQPFVLHEPLRVRWLPGELKSLKGQLDRLQYALVSGLGSLQRIRDNFAPIQSRAFSSSRPSLKDAVLM